MRFVTTTAIVCGGLLLSGSLAPAAETLKEAFTQGTLNGELRTFYFSRDFDGTTQDKEDQAFGTLLYYHTSPFQGISAALATATSSDLGSDKDKGVYGLLHTGSNGSHEDYARLQEYYLQADYFDTQVKVGAQEINMPLIIKQDVRMSPRTYRGLTVQNKSVENLTITGAYVTDYMLWFDDSFRNMGDVATGDEEKDSPFILGGVKYAVPMVDTVEGSGEVWYFNMSDYFNSVLLSGYLQKKFDGFKINLYPSFLKQDSLGDDLAGEFDTYHYGLKARFTWEDLKLTGFYSKTGDDQVFDPWSGARILVQQVLSSYRADEKAYGAQLEYDFGGLGAKGLSAYIFQGFYDTPDSGKNASSDATETDFNIEYKFSDTLDGLSVRGRYAMVNYDESSMDDIDDLRLYLTYSFSLNGK